MKKRIIIIEEETDEGLNGLTQTDLSGRQTYDPCAKCQNNPANNPNASGICNCVLPYMAGTKYQITCTCGSSWNIT